MNRRLFLERFARSAGCFVVTASIGGISACSRENPVSLRSGTSPVYSFPQGVASADPQSDAVILWTRIVSTTSGAPIEFTVQIAEDEDFSEVVAQLASGGRLVMPLGKENRGQMLVVLTKQDDGSVDQRDVLPVQFVPLTGDH